MNIPNGKPVPATMMIAKLTDARVQCAMNFRLATFILMIASSVYGQTNADKEFWDWFTGQAPEYRKLFSYERQVAHGDNPADQQQVEQTVKEIGRRLRQVHPKFTPYLGEANGQNELIISVRSEKEAFARVDQFVAQAPAIAGWKAIALRSPMKVDAKTQIRSGSVDLKIGDMQYTAQQQPGGAWAFTIYLPAKVSDDPEGFQQLAASLLRDLLGERLAATAVHSVKVQPLPAPPSANPSRFVDVHRNIVAAKGAN